MNSINPKSKFEFQAGKSIDDTIFTFHLVQEKAHGQNTDLYIIFIDLTEAFDTTNCEVLWKILSNVGLPDKIIVIMISLQKGMMTTVILSIQCSEVTAFFVVTGTQQDVF